MANMEGSCEKQNPVGVTSAGSSVHGSSHGSSPPSELHVPRSSSPSHSPSHSPKPPRSDRSISREVSPSDRPDWESQCSTMYRGDSRYSLLIPKNVELSTVPSRRVSHLDAPSPDSVSFGSIGRSIESILPPEFTRSVSQISQDSGKERKESRSSDRAKKKSSWYHSLTPNYKTRTEEFKKYFKDLPPEERLIVDYSCAVQKDILIQGRLYVTQNYLCFYSNIFGWETNINIRWKEVTSVTKEKTALIIPNAIMISTESDKLFFATFNQRDKAYVTVFRVWQNALMDKPLSIKEVWEWVHDAYGQELGLSSDDEYYEQKAAITTMLCPAIASPDTFLEESRSVTGSIPEKTTMTCDHVVEPSRIIHNGDGGVDALPTDLSDTTESDADRNIGSETVECPCTHEGRCLVHISLPIHVDQLFTTLFTNSKFFLEFHAMRRTTDIKASSWQPNPETAEKARTISMVVALAQTIGPKSAQITETQVMKPCSKPGKLYAIDGDVINGGIPYADSFYVINHYCLVRTGDHQTSFTVHAQLKYKKSVWGLVKSVIEKSTWAGLDEFYDSLVKALQGEYGEPGTKGRKHRRRPRGAVPPVLLPADDLSPQSRVASIKKGVGDGETRKDVLIGVVLAVLLFLLVLNVLLYYKLWVLEAWAKSSRPSISSIDLEVLRNPPKTHEEWLELFRQQETLHKAELARWQAVLQAAVRLLRRAEEALNGLQDISYTPRDEL